MAKDLKIRAEQEADKIGLQFAHSTDVIGDMSRAYHVDFSRIQIHTDEVAEQKVRAAGKDGLAQGNHLFFGRGIFESNAPADKMLIAHELVHTMQQGVTDVGLAVSEHVPMGTAQYGKSKAIGSVTDSDSEDEDFVPNEEDDDDYYEEFERIVGKGFELHHFATNKNSRYTPLFNEIVSKYNLDLDGAWNKETLPHHGRHTMKYHQFVYEKMLEIDQEAQQKETELGQKFCFLFLFGSRVKSEVRSKPEILYS